jgi:hypothetical protein
VATTSDFNLLLVADVPYPQCRCGFFSQYCIDDSDWFDNDDPFQDGPNCDGDEDIPYQECGCCPSLEELFQQNPTATSCFTGGADDLTENELQALMKVKNWNVSLVMTALDVEYNSTGNTSPGSCGECTPGGFDSFSHITFEGAAVSTNTMNRNSDNPCVSDRRFPDHFFKYFSVRECSGGIPTFSYLPWADPALIEEWCAADSIYGYFCEGLIYMSNQCYDYFPTCKKTYICEEGEDPFENEGEFVDLNEEYEWEPPQGPGVGLTNLTGGSQRVVVSYSEFVGSLPKVQDYVGYCYNSGSGCDYYTRCSGGGEPTYAEIFRTSFESSIFHAPVFGPKPSLDGIGTVVDVLETPATGSPECTTSTTPSSCDFQNVTPAVYATKGRLKQGTCKRARAWNPYNQANNPDGWSPDVYAFYTAGLNSLGISQGVSISGGHPYYCQKGDFAKDTDRESASVISYLQGGGKHMFFLRSGTKQAKDTSGNLLTYDGTDPLIVPTFAIAPFAEGYMYVYGGTLGAGDCYGYYAFSLVYFTTVNKFCYDGGYYCYDASYLNGRSLALEDNDLNDNIPPYYVEYATYKTKAPCSYKDGDFIPCYGNHWSCYKDNIACSGTQQLQIRFPSGVTYRESVTVPIYAWIRGPEVEDPRFSASCSTDFTIVWTPIDNWEVEY